MNTEKPAPTQKLRRAVWLAFQASSPMGMGWLHQETANSLTEETVIDDENLDRKNVYLDYHAGRMMKTQFKVDEQGILTIAPEEPRHDYQSWTGTYPTASALVEAVEKSFE